MNGNALEALRHRGLVRQAQRGHPDALRAVHLQAAGDARRVALGRCGHVQHAVQPVRHIVVCALPAVQVQEILQQRSE